MGKIRKVTKAPKPESLDIDSERLVRDLLDALTLVEAPPKPLARFSPEQPNLGKTAKRPERRETAVGRAEDPGRAATLVPTLSEAATDMAAQTSSKTSIGVSSERRDILEQFCLDDELRERMHVTPQELDALAHSSLLGSLTSKQDLLFMLRTLRECVPSATEHTTGAVYFEMAEDIRRDSLRKLVEWDLRETIVRRRAWGLLVPCAGIFAAGLILLLKIVPCALLSTEAINWFRVLA